MMSYNSTLQKWLYYNSPYFIKNTIASIYGWVEKRQRYGEHFERYLRFLSESQWFSSRELEEFQFQRTKAFLVHAEKHSKYYHDLFNKHCFKPEKVDSFSDLRVLPILDKSTVRHHTNEIVPDNLSSFNARWTRTGGTTGECLHLAISSECFQHDWAFRVLDYSWGGIRLGTKWAFCAGHPVAHHDCRRPPFWVYDYVNKWLFLSSYHLTESNLPHYISELQKFQPDLLGGYPSSIYLLALANQYLGSPVHPCAIFTSSETLFDYQRTVIERAFGCKVFSYYGNAERCGHIAECEKGVYHLKPEHSYVEFLDYDNKPVQSGCEGRMVCTAFGNYAMPLVRYDIGDFAVLSKSKTCECGRRGILLEETTGRMDDYILTPDGRFVGRLSHLWKNASNIKMAQVVQNNIQEVVIRVVKEPAYTAKEEQSILDKARAKLGRELHIHFEYVDDIPRTKNGKFRHVISNVGGKKMFSNVVVEGKGQSP